VAGFIGSPAMNFLEAKLTSDNGVVNVVTGGFTLPLPADKAEKATAEGYVGANVIFGIRPEDLHDAAVSLVPATDQNQTTMRIDVIEPMGDRVIVYAMTGDDTVLGSLEGNTRAREESDLDVVLNMDKCHIFDAQTE